MSNAIVRRLSFEPARAGCSRKFDFVLEEGVISSDSYFAFRLPSHDLPQEAWITSQIIKRCEDDLKEQLDLLKDLKKNLNNAQIEVRDGKKASRSERKSMLLEYNIERQKLLKDET